MGSSYSRSAFLQVQTPFGTITRSSDGSFAPAYRAGTGLIGRHNRFLIGLESSLLYMRPGLEVENQQGDITSYKQPMNSFSVTVSVGYEL